MKKTKKKQSFSKNFSKQYFEFIIGNKLIYYILMNNLKKLIKT